MSCRGVLATPFLVMAIALPAHGQAGDTLLRVSVPGRPERGFTLAQLQALGYQVVFALAELDPSFRAEGEPPVLLVWAEDGAPVAPEYGPLRIVAAGELVAKATARRCR